MVHKLEKGHKSLQVNETSRFLTIRRLNKGDMEFTYLLSNKEVTRLNSYNKKLITIDEHKVWFKQKLNDNNSFYYIGQYKSQNVAFIRIDLTDTENVIGITIDKKFRGLGLSSPLLIKIRKAFKNQFPNRIIRAYIKKDNIASLKSFAKAGFIYSSDCIINNFKSEKYII